MILGTFLFQLVGHCVLGEDESNQSKDREKAFQMPGRMMPAPPYRQAQKKARITKVPGN